MKLKVAEGPLPIMGSYGLANPGAEIEVTEEEAKALEKDNRGKAHWTKDEKDADKASRKAEKQARKASKPADDETEEAETEEGVKEEKANRQTKEEKSAKNSK